MKNKYLIIIATTIILMFSSLIGFIVIRTRINKIDNTITGNVAVQKTNETNLNTEELIKNTEENTEDIKVEKQPEENIKTEEEQLKQNAVTSNKVIENKEEAATTQQKETVQTAKKQVKNNTSNTAKSKKNENTTNNIDKTNTASVQTPVTLNKEKVETQNIEQKNNKEETSVETSKEETTVEVPKKETITETPKTNETTTNNETQNNQTQETKPITCTNANNHYTSAGNSGEWFTTQQDAISFYETKIAYWGKKWENNEIDDQTYYKNCPYGYETWSCGLCGKWTINFYYR